ncbi:MAG: hypothetical protein ACFFCD_06270 [Promethearchaeota archaeon]
MAKKVKEALIPEKFKIIARNTIYKISLKKDPKKNLVSGKVTRIDSSVITKEEVEYIVEKSIAWAKISNSIGAIVHEFTKNIRALSSYKQKNLLFTYNVKNEGTFTIGYLDKEEEIDPETVQRILKNIASYESTKHLLQTLIAFTNERIADALDIRKLFKPWWWK